MGALPDEGAPNPNCQGPKYFEWSLAAGPFHSDISPIYRPRASLPYKLENGDLNYNFFFYS